MNLRCFELFAEKLETGWGKAFFGDVPSRVFTLAMLRHHPFYSVFIALSSCPIIIRVKIDLSSL